MAARNGQKRTAPKRLLSFDIPGSTRAENGNEVLTESPVEIADSTTPRKQRPGGPRRSRKPTALSISSLVPQDSPEAAPPSPSATRWESIRKNVLPAPRPATPPVPTTEQTTSSSLSLPPRAPTPKQSRFAARLGFRQVVEHAREAAVDDSRRFAYEVQRACTSARHVDLKPDRDPSNPSVPVPSSAALGHSPFASSLSLANAAISHKKHELRTAPSRMSLISDQRGGPSLKHMLQTLMRFSAPSADGTLISPSLPYESQVMSALLSPFLVPNGPAVDEERFFAIETFDLIARTWTASEEVGIERCLWCCKAARVSSSSLRSRIVTNLANLLVSDNASCSAEEPGTLKMLMQALFTLLPFLASQASSASDRHQVDTLKNLITKVIAGQCGHLNTEAVQEDYNATLETADDYQLVRDALAQEALAYCLENSSRLNATWMLENMVEEYWPVLAPQASSTPVLRAIHSKKLNTSCRFIRSLLKSEATILHSQMSLARWLMQTRLIPESDTTSDRDLKTNIVHVVLEMIALDTPLDIVQWAGDLFEAWHRNGGEWKLSVEEALKAEISQKEWSVSLKMLVVLLSAVPNDIRKALVINFLPALNEQLVANPPTEPSPELTSLLTTLATSYPNLFFKPLFACAASSKELTIAIHLCTITVLSKFHPDFLKNAEMVCVALMNTGKDGFTLGQTVLLLEIVGHMQAARHAKESLTDPNDPTFVQTARFAIELEARLGMLLEVKEVPITQRMLLCMLFREIRLLTRSFKTPLWLSRTINWFTEYHLNNEEEDDSVLAACDSIEQIYAVSGGGVRPTNNNKRRTTVILASTTDSGQMGRSHENVIPFSAHPTLVASLSRGFVPHALKLFVAMSSMISSEDYNEKLGPLIWREHLENKDYITSACFLAQQCAERSNDHTGFITDIEVDLRSSHSRTRLSAIKKLNSLIIFRFSVLSQPALSDRAHRIFKVARGPLPFVSTDVGSSRYVPDDVESSNTSGMPLELRQRLRDIGWAEEKAPDERVALINTPISSLSLSSWQQELDRLEGDSPPSPSPSATDINSGSSPVPLLRRNSSNGGPTTVVKRRAVFVPALSTVIPYLALLLRDSDFIVAFTARQCLVDLIKNDPTFATRPALDLLSEDVPAAITTMRCLLHACGDPMPPALSHIMFNNLAGYLKHISKHANASDRSFEDTIPVLATLVPHINNFAGLRDVRKAKLELTLIPSGHLWFPSTAPACFPTSSTSIRDLTTITIIRASQNMAFLAMLKRSPTDVQIIRRSMSKLVLPSLVERTTVLADYLPRATPQESGDPLDGLSLILSRSYLLLVAQIFRCFTRHIQDRADLAVFIEGINTILLRHGRDISIIAHALIALMVAMTRFRRMFSKGGGFTLFMPSLFKVYSQAESHTGIREAVEFAVNRFFALHQESFIFQSLEIIAHITTVANSEESDRIARVLYHLFSTLNRPQSSQDAAAIHGLNRIQEREALLVSTADEQPQTFLASLRSGDKGTVIVDVPDEYTSKTLAIDDFVRIFLTVIAHDPSIVRAQIFLRTFRYLCPYLYSSESSREVLSDGITALGAILLKAAAKGSGRATRAETDATVDDSTSFLENRLLELSKKPSDISEMMLDYLSLIVAFTSAGGWLDTEGSNHAMDLVRILLNGTADVVKRLSTFLTEYTRTSLLRETINVKELGPFLDRLCASMASAFCSVIDFTGAYETLAIFAAKSQLAGSPVFTEPLIRICAIGLDNLESEDSISSQESRTSLVSLLGHAFLHDAAIIPLLESRAPTYSFLAFILLPLSLKLSAEPTGELMSTRTIHPNTWLRILMYALAACKTGPTTNNKHANGVQVGTVVLALQIVKIVSVHTEELSTSCPDIWSRLAIPVMAIIGQGNAQFATGYHDTSPVASPFQSPVDHSTANPPRLVDYLLWSFLHFMCLHRSPVKFQMRMFMQEKVHELDVDLRISTPGARGRRLSAFSKPRRRISGIPQLSPMLSPSNSHSYDLSAPSTPVPSRQAGYQRSPISPSVSGPRQNRIVHLGPISSPSFRRSASPSGETVKTLIVKSSVLIKSTYERIRLVQSQNGYDRLLPLPRGQQEEFGRQSWSRKDALEALSIETALLLEEFSTNDIVGLDSFTLDN